MTTAVLTAGVPASRERWQTAATLSLLLLGGLATATAAVLSNGNPLIALAPLVCTVVTYALWVSPIRYALFALIFLSLSLDALGEGPWESPLAPLGYVLHYNLNNVLPIRALVLPGMAVAMLVLLALAIQRHFAGATTDSLGRSPTASALLGAVGVSFIAVLAWWLVGAVRHGDMQMAKNQVQSYLQVLIMAYVASAALRGSKDYRTLGQIIVMAAVARSFYVIWVVYHIAPRLGVDTIGVAATHGDSMLFASAALLLIVRFLEKPSLWSGAWCAALLPLMAVAMSGNNRRLVWVELVSGLILFAVISRRSRMKRLLAYGGLLALPLFLTYVAVGWNSQSKIFAPIHTYRSVTDGTEDSSTLYRDLENYNLLKTMRIYPMTGMGFGRPFLEEVTLPDISGIFKEYQYLPHNSILGLWAFAGPFGFTGISLAIVVAAFLAGRSYHLARSADERIAAFMVLAVIAVYLIHCWGDIGFSEMRSPFLVGPALAIAGQLACATGAWRVRMVKHT